MKPNASPGVSCRSFSSADSARAVPPRPRNIDSDDAGFIRPRGACPDPQPPSPDHAGRGSRAARSRTAAFYLFICAVSKEYAAVGPPAASNSTGQFHLPLVFAKPR